MERGVRGSGRRRWRGVRLTEGKGGCPGGAGPPACGVWGSRWPPREEGRQDSRRTVGMAVTAPEGVSAVWLCGGEGVWEPDRIGARSSGTLPGRLPPARILHPGTEVIASASTPQAGRGAAKRPSAGSSPQDPAPWRITAPEGFSGLGPLLGPLGQEDACVTSVALFLKGGRRKTREMVQWLETPALKPEDPIKSLRPTHSVVLTPTLKLCVAHTCTKSFFNCFKKAPNSLF